MQQLPCSYGELQGAATAKKAAHRSLQARFESIPQYEGIENGLWGSFVEIVP